MNGTHFKLGDLVCIKGQGRKVVMVIGSYHDKDNTVAECYWVSEDREPKHIRLPVAILEPGD